MRGLLQCASTIGNFIATALERKGFVEQCLTDSVYHFMLRLREKLMAFVQNFA